MVLRYNYATEELKLRKADRKSYFCYPILDENHRVLGVMYFDSSHPNTFTLDSTIARMKMIMRACDAIRDNLL
jgi:putative methionine-R-sulfoxide reductase with GAF domain